MTISQNRRSFWITLALFTVSRLAYVPVNMEFFTGNSVIAWQLLDVECLRTDLLNSVWHMHSQPPLFNLFNGVLQKIMPEAYEAPMQIAFMLLGLGILLMMEAILRGLGAAASVKWPLLAMIAFNPNFQLVEKWYFYTYPLAGMILGATLCWMRMFETRKAAWGAGCFALLSTIALTRSLFHISWFVVLAGVGLFLLRGSRRRLLVPVMIAFLPLFGWYLKNAMMFGSFSASTWMGMSLAKQTTFQLGEVERRELIARGKLSELALIEPFSRVLVYRDHFKLEKTGVEVLDQYIKSSGETNFNHIGMIDICRKYQRDAMYVLIHRPGRFLYGQVDAWNNYFQTVALYVFLRANAARAPGLENFYDAFVYFQYPIPPRKYDTGGKGAMIGYYQPLEDRRFSFMLAAVFMTILLGGPILIIRDLRRAEARARGATLLFMWLMIMYVSFAGNLLETGENNRFRFNIEAPSWIFFAVCLQRGWLAGRRAVTRRRPESGPTPSLEGVKSAGAGE